MSQTKRRDNGTDQRLPLLIGLVAVFAAGVATLSLLDSIRNPPTSGNQLITVAMLILTVTISLPVKAPIRIRSTTHATAWVETAIVIGVAVAPTSWVVLCTGLGVAVATRIMRLSSIKTIFTISKNMLVAAGAGTTLTLLGWVWPPPDGLPYMIAPLAAAYAVAALLDEALGIPVIALAARTNVLQHFVTNWDLRLAGFGVRFVVAVFTLILLRVETWLLVAMPPLALSLHLAYSTRVRARAERYAWQRLAHTTDALNVVDLNAVLRTAVAQAADLFSADEVEVELQDNKRTVRGNSETISYDGFASPPSFTNGSIIPMEMKGYDGSAVGMLRLRFHGPVKLSEREQYTLRTFASALCTAVRNASAYAELNRVAEEHAHAAAHDALTGLANRRHLLDRGADQLGQRRTEGVIALLLIDLNHFKEVNDTLGHAAGDRVLIQVAERLRAAVQGDDLVARLGGDEFAVLFHGLPAPAVAAHRAESLLTALHEPIDLDGMRISVEASGGIAVAPSTGGMTELLRRADVAMYQAKRAGRRIATYAPARDTADLSRLALGGDLPRAVADHEFTVNFQPIVDLGSGEVVAAEALARWRHPARGTIDPLRFLETVERSGLLPAFAEAVLDQSLIAAQTWREAGFDLPVAVNVSPRSLLDARFPGAVLARLRAHDLPPDRLVLELTETLTLSQLEVVDQVLGQLRDAGIRLALDDFGTGYSSLSVLSRIPVHELKIDRAFVTAMETSAEATAVIRSTVDLGRSLNLVVVAEGVESEPQRMALWELGCSAGQGHLFARPMPAARLLSALHQGAGGRPGTLAPALHDEGAVVRLSPGRRSGPRRVERLPHLPA
ncbi:bifunctional diguanylate cyclase/phosphodiesterase [Plantactinospora sp. S1510]|uniref:Bifunctional diguanylate cyclase/phosphodiesterase n=1 Tax=Plantactinospora alkalitolerans TaxID=2789879 RepID=A0ABS0GPX4_9ACTN|nr:bifunctional diguanylate cyclase/phosphodiesterase [Plantactinospora alkalitolerans]MBF9128245.1 bifunctional diguanylate cyclase/phosphodiesterase [Plantactinospora alkalitolerans]